MTAAKPKAYQHNFFVGDALAQLGRLAGNSNARNCLNSHTPYIR